MHRDPLSATSMDVEPTVTATEIVVRYAETDQMGIVHHSVYAIWFEAARTDFCEKIGFSYDHIEATGVMSPLAQLSCDFIRPARYADHLVITTQIVRLTVARIAYAYAVYHAADWEAQRTAARPLATGQTMHAHTDLSLRPINLKKKRPEIFEALAHAQGASVR
jgi:acyl-CoA thioester hydrolase